MLDERLAAEQGAAHRRAVAPHQGSRHLEVQREVSTREAALILGRSERTIQRAIAKGEIAATRVGSAYRISPAELARCAGSTPPAQPSPPTPPLASIVALPGATARLTSLPEPLSSFVGRDEELARVVSLLEDPAVRVITLTGPGGIGKTRLATAAASVVQDWFADGVLFIGLEAIRRPDRVIPAIAKALGLRERPGQPRQEQLQRFLRDKQMLLLLDNLEQVLPAAPAIAELVAMAKRLTMLATSRAPLRISGEREIVLAPLALPGPGASLAELLASDAGRLFHRARGRARPGLRRRRGIGAAYRRNLRPARRLAAGH
jgi:excisionase family DNA binding protein